MCSAVRDDAFWRDRVPYATFWTAERKCSLHTLDSEAGPRRDRTVVVCLAFSQKLWLCYSNYPALREPAERGGSGLLADFARKRVVSQRPRDSLRPSGPKALIISLNGVFS